MKEENTIDDLKNDIQQSENEIKQNKSILILQLMDINDDITQVINSDDYDANYFQKAVVEMDYRIKHGNENGQYIEPVTEECTEEEKTPLRTYKKKSLWRRMKENFKKVIL